MPCRPKAWIRQGSSRPEDEHDVYQHFLKLILLYPHGSQTSLGCMRPHGFWDLLVTACGNTKVSQLFKVIQISLDGTCWLNKPSFMKHGEHVSV